MPPTFKFRVGEEVRVVSVPRKANGCFYEADSGGRMEELIGSILEIKHAFIKKSISDGREYICYKTIRPQQPAEFWYWDETNFESVIPEISFTIRTEE